MTNAFHGLDRHWHSVLRAALLFAVCGAAIAQQSAASRALVITNITPSGTGISTSSVSGTSSVPSCSFPAFPGL